MSGKKLSSWKTAPSGMLYQNEDVKFSSDREKILKYVRKHISRHFKTYNVGRWKDGAFIISVTVDGQPAHGYPNSGEIKFHSLVYVAYGPQDLGVFRIGRPWEVAKTKERYQWQEIPLADPKCAEKVVALCDQIIRDLIWKRKGKRP